MAYSTCCGAHTKFTEIDICPDCLEHCDWEYEADEEELEQQQLNKKQ
jgi:hypothetical protein